MFGNGLHARVRGYLRADMIFRENERESVGEQWMYAAVAYYPAGRGTQIFQRRKGGVATE